MRRLIITVFIVMPFISLTQGIRFSSQTGYAIGEMKDQKKIMLSTGTNLGVELNIGVDVYFTISTGGSLLQFNYNDNASGSVFNKKYFIHLPVSVKKYYRISKRSWMFWDFGVSPDYLIADKKEITGNSNTITIKTKNLGFNFAFISNFGFKTMLTSKIFFDVGVFDQTDCFFHYKNASDKIKTKRNMLMFSFYRIIR